MKKNNLSAVLCGRHNQMGAVYSWISWMWWGSDEKVVLGMNVHSANEHNVKEGDDVVMPFITGCKFMPNGDLVLCDYESKHQKLMLLNNGLEVKDSLKLCSNPWDVSVVDNNNVIVTLPKQKKLQFVQVFPSLKAGRVIELDRKCYGIAVDGNEIYITCHDDGQGEVRILDTDGSMMKILSDHKGEPFQTPEYLTVSKISKKIFVTDQKASTVTCMTRDGDIVYHYKDDELEDPEGLFVDGGDNIFVCSHGTYVVQVIKAEGKKHSNLLAPANGTKHPCCIAFRQSDNTIVVGSMLSYEIYSFKLCQ